MGFFVNSLSWQHLSPGNRWLINNRCFASLVPRRILGYGLFERPITLTSSPIKGSCCAVRIKVAVRLLSLEHSPISHWLRRNILFSYREWEAYTVVTIPASSWYWACSKSVNRPWSCSQVYCWMRSSLEPVLSSDQGIDNILSHPAFSYTSSFSLLIWLTFSLMISLMLCFNSNSQHFFFY